METKFINILQQYQRRSASGDKVRQHPPKVPAPQREWRRSSSTSSNSTSAAARVETKFVNIFQQCQRHSASGDEVRQHLPTVPAPQREWRRSSSTSSSSTSAAARAETKFVKILQQYQRRSASEDEVRQDPLTVPAPQREWRRSSSRSSNSTSAATRVETKFVNILQQYQRRSASGDDDVTVSEVT